MTHGARSLCLFLTLSVTPATGLAESPSSPSASRVTEHVPPGTASHPIGGSIRSRVGTRPQPSFWDDSVKAIQEGGWDVGGWLADRRRLLVEASLTNRYFWFCITSFTANILLMSLFYAGRVSEERKVWKATSAMTDLWNWALFADWSARNAIEKFNRHMEQCNKQGNEGFPSVLVPASDAGEIIGVQKERDALRQELATLQSELTERDRVITNLNTRVDEVAKTVAGGSDPKAAAQWMEKVNMLSLRNQQLEQQLASVQSKLEQLAPRLS